MTTQETFDSDPMDQDLSPADYDDLQEVGGGVGKGNSQAALSMVYDLPLPVSVELGRTRLPVQEILGLGRGSVVQLDRLAGEPVDLFVGDRRFAEGEVVVMGEQFGVRITRIVAVPGARDVAGAFGG